MSLRVALEQQSPDILVVAPKIILSSPGTGVLSISILLEHYKYQEKEDAGSRSFTEWAACPDPDDVMCLQNLLRWPRVAQNRAENLARHSRTSL